MFKLKNPFAKSQEPQESQDPHSKFCRTCKWVTDWDSCNGDGEYSKCTNHNVNETHKPIYQSIEERCVGKTPSFRTSTEHFVYCSNARKNYNKCKEEGIYWTSKDDNSSGSDISSMNHEERLIREQIKKLEHRLGSIKKETLK